MPSHDPSAAPELRIPSDARGVLRLALPVVLSMLAHNLMGITDTFYMGWVGNAAQAALGLGAVLSWTLLSLFIGTLSVINTYVAQLYGAREYARCGGYLWLGLLLAAGFSLLALAVTPAVDGLLRLLGTDPSVTPIAGAYIRIRLFGAPATLAEICFVSFLRGIGDTRTPMLVAIGAVLLNVVLDYWLVFGGLGIPPLGANGAAYATVVAITLQATVLGALTLRSALRRTYGLGWPRTLDRRALLELLKVGSPIGAGWLQDSLIWTIFTGFVSRSGDAVLAAHNVVVQVVLFSYLPGMALSVAATTLVGQHLGARAPALARRTGVLVLRIATAYMGTMGLIFLCFGSLIARAFNRDPLVVSTAHDLFLFAAGFQLFDAIGVTSSGILRGAGNTRYPMLVSTLSAWAVFFPLLLLLRLRFGWGVYGCWLAALLYIFALGVALYLKVRRLRWDEIGLLTR
ncbi:MAG: MATE family efflux transporter [Deltaproteobacteria bacterium]|nr:MATE family efflux transporter [Deltaproteobacteria bacterium]